MNQPQEQRIIDKPIIVLVGPTAIGKTALSLRIGQQFNCEIVSVDSMQVYRYMDIGTAKASSEERALLPHHLIDIVDPDEEYDASRFVHDSLQAIASIHARNRIPLLTGGTGLYLKALFQGLAPAIGPSDGTLRDELKARLEKEGPDKLHEELSAYDCLSAERINKNDSSRLLRAIEIYKLTGKSWSEHLQEHQQSEPPLRCSKLIQLALTSPRDELYNRINLRTRIMLDSGLEAEVKELLERGYSPELKPFGAIGYKHMLQYLSGSWNYEEMAELLARDTRRYAKRQYTWFSKVEGLQWLDVERQDEAIRLIDQMLAN